MYLLNDLANLNPEQLEALYSKLDENTAQGVLIALQTELIQRCATDGLFWLKFVVTRDEADPLTSVKPVPLHLDYVPEIWRVLVENKKVVVAKSRQMFMSWLLSLFMCWWARFKPNQAIYYQTQKAEDADAMVSLAGNVQGRCQFIESHLPDFLKLRVRPTQGNLQYPNGSMIQALAGGADQIRGKVASLIVQDEYAFQPEARGVYTACAPLIQKGTHFVAVSTPNGTTNQFATLYHGRELGAA